MIFLDVLANILQEEFLDIAFLFRIRCLNLRTTSYVYVESGLADFKYQRIFSIEVNTDLVVMRYLFRSLHEIHR